MRKVIIPLVIFSVFHYACYTAGYTAFGGWYFNGEFSNEADYKTRMNNFGIENPTLLIDSVLTKQYFKNIYLDETQRRQLEKPQQLYPAFPLVNWTGLNSWFLTHKGDSLIYELALFNCTDSKNKQCGIAIYNVYQLTSNGFANPLIEKKNGISKQNRDAIIASFEKNILPKLRPYFERQLID